jgi:hypothetical protein
MKVCMLVIDCEWLVAASVLFFSAKMIQDGLYGRESIWNKSTDRHPIQSHFSIPPFLQLSLYSCQNQTSSHAQFDLPPRPRLRSDAADPIPLHTYSRSRPLLQSLKPLES